MLGGIFVESLTKFLFVICKKNVLTNCYFCEISIFYIYIEKMKFILFMWNIFLKNFLTNCGFKGLRKTKMSETDWRLLTLWISCNKYWTIKFWWLKNPYYYMKFIIIFCFIQLSDIAKHNEDFVPKWISIPQIYWQIEFFLHEKRIQFIIQNWVMRKFSENATPFTS